VALLASGKLLASRLMPRLLLLLLLLLLLRLPLQAQPLYGNCLQLLLGQSCLLQDTAVAVLAGIRQLTAA
jgi:hypothetical protein